MRTLRALFLSLVFLFTALAVSGPASAAPVDINTADAQTLAQTIKGIGPRKAAAIVTWRQDHGPFKSVDDLALIKGIGQKTVEANREVITVKPRTAEAGDDSSLRPE